MSDKLRAEAGRPRRQDTDAGTETNIVHNEKTARAHLMKKKWIGKDTLVTTSLIADYMKQYAEKTTAGAEVKNMLNAFAFALESACLEPAAEHVTKAISAKISKLVEEAAEKVNKATESTTKLLDAVSLKYGELTIAAMEATKGLKEGLAPRPTGQSTGYGHLATRTTPPIINEAVASNIVNLRKRQIMAPTPPKIKKQSGMYSRDEVNAYKETLNNALGKMGEETKEWRVAGVRFTSSNTTLLEMNSITAAQGLRGKGKWKRVMDLAYGTTDEEVQIIPRTYRLTIRFAPVGWSPEDDEALRAFETENRLPTNSVYAASWIKNPANRYKGQSFANVKMTCTLPEVANRLILGPTRINDHVVKVQKEQAFIPLCAKNTAQENVQTSRAQCAPHAGREATYQVTQETLSMFYFTNDKWSFDSTQSPPWNAEANIAGEPDSEEVQGPQPEPASSNQAPSYAGVLRKSKSTTNLHQTTLNFGGTAPAQVLQGMHMQLPTSSATPANKKTPQTKITNQANPNAKSPDAHGELINTLSPDEWDIIAIQEPALNSIENIRATQNWQVFYPCTKVTDNHSKLRAVTLVNVKISYCEQVRVASSDIEPNRMYIYNIYNDSTNNDTLEQLAKHLEGQRPIERQTQSIWLGNFNRHHHMWEGHANRHIRSPRDKITPLLNLIIEHGMQQLLPAGIPTRMENSSETRPDNVWASEGIVRRTIECNTWLEWRPNTTDHLPIVTIIEARIERSQEEARPNYKRTDWEKFREGVQAGIEGMNMLSLELESIEDIEDVVDKLTECMQENLRKTTPVSKPAGFQKP
ncbi:SubName: Full=Uncharacterized protein {ECO:0000313/EMBL:CCA76396.1} [Serendipita indica DSM 11827]|nr:SubName: Full=Uncharacterized protein {ECO:0000313/EMBL:CCA76396.1} [Serendipita indica DSM 11827]